MGLQSPPTRRVSRSRPEGEAGQACRADEWLRELFSGTYDLREAEARRRPQAHDWPFTVWRPDETSVAPRRSRQAVVPGH
jgi:uncharacterized protein (DUF58 family)